MEWGPSEDKTLFSKISVSPKTDERNGINISWRYRKFLVVSTHSWLPCGVYLSGSLLEDEPPGNMGPCLIHLLYPQHLERCANLLNYIVTFYNSLIPQRT